MCLEVGRRSRGGFTYWIYNGCFLWKPSVESEAATTEYLAIEWWWLWGGFRSGIQQGV